MHFTFSESSPLTNFLQIPQEIGILNLQIFNLNFLETKLTVNIKKKRKSSPLFIKNCLTATMK
jgi:hypothetical protein